MPPEHRISCHRCGNIRKRRVLCPKSTCPHTFCGRCAEKLKEEHGSSVFMGGCPVCKELCCCNNKSVYCHRKNHCYRKCPSTRSSSYTLKPQQDHHHHHRLDYDSDGDQTSSKGAHRSAERFVSSRGEVEATHTAGIFDLLAAVADGVVFEQQRTFVEDNTAVPEAVRVAKSAIVASSLSNAPSALKVHRTTSAANRKKPKLSKQDGIAAAAAAAGGASCFNPSLLQHGSRPLPSRGYFPPSMRNSNAASSSMHMLNPTNSFAPGLGSYNSYSTAAAFNNYNPFHNSSSSSSASSFLHLSEHAYPPLMDYNRSSSQQKRTSTDATPAEEEEEQSSGRSTSAAAIDRILSLSMDNNNNNNKSTYQQSLQHLLGEGGGGGGGMCELAVMPVDCGFDGYTGALLQSTHPHVSIGGAGEGYTTCMQFNGPSAVRSSVLLDQQSRDAMSIDHLLLLGATKNPFLQPSNAASMDAVMHHGLRLTNSFQLAHNSNRDMQQLPSIPTMMMQMRSKAQVDDDYASSSSLYSFHNNSSSSSSSSRTSVVDQRQIANSSIIPVSNATTAALSESSPVTIDASRLSIEATDITQQQQQQLSSSSSSSRLSAAAIDDTARLCPMNLLALVSSFSKAMDRPAVVEKDRCELIDRSIIDESMA